MRSEKEMFNLILDFSKRNKLIKAVMNKGTLNGGTLYGRAGTSGENKNGWFVGFYEKNNRYLYFAIRLSDGENATGLQAPKIARSIIEKYYCLM